MLAQGLVVMPDGSRPVVPLADDDCVARSVGAAAPTTTAALELGAAASARAAYLAEVMRTPSCVGMPVQPSNVAAEWGEIVAAVERELTPQSASAHASDDANHGWAATFAKVAEEERQKTPGRSADDNFGWGALLSNPQPA